MAKKKEVKVKPIEETLWESTNPHTMKGKPNTAECNTLNFAASKTWKQRIHSLNEGMPLAQEWQLGCNLDRQHEALGFVPPAENA